MTVEDLSSATAERSTGRMQHDLKATTHIRTPPRPTPPSFAREAADVVSARVDAIEDSNTETLVQEDVRMFLAAFERLEPSLRSLLTPQQRARVAAAVNVPPPAPEPKPEPVPPPAQPIQQVLSDPIVAVALVAGGVALLAALVNRTQDTPFRSTNENRPPTSAMMSHIDRLLRPFSRAR